MKKETLKEAKVLIDDIISSKLQSLLCRFCLGKVVIRNDKDNTLRCTSKACRKEEKIFQNNIFKFSKIPIKIILEIIYFWYVGTSKTLIKCFTSVSIKAIKNIITKLSGSIQHYFYQKDTKIGGQGIIVEIDESKFGKRKHNRGRHVEGVWVIGAAERTEERKVVFERVQNRNSETIKSFIQRNIKRGSIIYSDCWKGYKDLNEMGYYHYTVNHSQEFINRVNGVHTNTIEGNWSALKFLIPKRCRNKKYIDAYLLLFMLFRNEKNSIFKKLIEFLIKN
jgi:transposase-like protein